MSQLRLLAVLTGLITIWFAPSAHAAPCASADALPRSAPSHARSATLCLINQKRSTYGRRSLRLNKLLGLAAHRHSSDMVRNQYFAHNSLAGRKFDARIKSTGYLAGAATWDVGENLGWGAGRKGSPRQMVAAWMASPTHRRVLLDRRFTQIGIALAAGAPVGGHRQATTYATEFGRRSLAR